MLRKHSSLDVWGITVLCYFLWQILHLSVKQKSPSELLLFSSQMHFRCLQKCWTVLLNAIFYATHLFLSTIYCLLFDKHKKIHSSVHWTVCAAKWTFFIQSSFDCKALLFLLKKERTNTGDMSNYSHPGINEMTGDLHLMEQNQQQWHLHVPAWCHYGSVSQWAFWERWDM